jgi:hypothetical protein
MRFPVQLPVSSSAVGIGYPGDLIRVEAGGCGGHRADGETGGDRQGGGRSHYPQASVHRDPRYRCAGDPHSVMAGLPRNPARSAPAVPKPRAGEWIGRWTGCSVRLSEPGQATPVPRRPRGCGSVRLASE